jgi:hypothetical protein
LSEWNGQELKDSRFGTNRGTLCLLSVELFAVVILPSCVNDVHPPAPGAPSEIVRCFSDPVPSGYLRINSEDTDPGGCLCPPMTFCGFVYTPYTALNVGTVLEVCSDDVLTDAMKQGWEVWSLPFRDTGLFACDAQTGRVKNDPTYLNAINIKKTS